LREMARVQSSYDVEVRQDMEAHSPQLPTVSHLSIDPLVPHRLRLVRITTGPNAIDT